MRTHPVHNWHHVYALTRPPHRWRYESLATTMRLRITRLHEIMLDDYRIDDEYARSPVRGRLRMAPRRCPIVGAHAWARLRARLAEAWS